MKKLYLGILVLIPFLLVGCMANPLYKPSLRLNKHVLPEYYKYVQDDPKLTQEQKTRRHNACDDYGRLLKDYGETEGD